MGPCCVLTLHLRCILFFHYYIALLGRVYVGERVEWEKRKV